tara:strand:- start:5619 stop:6503 length:885 start_codon:yes stop_codon:yes gene_type:complete
MALADTDWVKSIIDNNPWLQNFNTDFINTLIDNVIMEGITDTQELLDIVRQSPAYQDRFPGLVKRETKGLSPMSEAEYVEYETVIFGLLNSYGVADVFASGGIGGSEFRNKIGDLVEGDVSANQFASRLDKGYAAVVDNIDEVAATFSNFYNADIGESDLLAYFLDPEVGIELIENQVATAQIGASAQKFGLNIMKTQAEGLEEFGITEKLAREGFAEVSREKESLTKLANIHRIQPLSDENLADYIFHEDSNIAAQRKQIFDTALSEFQAGGSSRLTREGGIAGLGKRERGGY